MADCIKKSLNFLSCLRPHRREPTSEAWEKWWDSSTHPYCVCTILARQKLIYSMNEVLEQPNSKSRLSRSRERHRSWTNWIIEGTFSCFTASKKKAGTALWCNFISQGVKSSKPNRQSEEMRSEAIKVFQLKAKIIFPDKFYPRGAFYTTFLRSFFVLHCMLWISFSGVNIMLQFQ